jgi:hypothetical protein
MSKKQDRAVKAIDEMLHNLKKPKLVPYKDIIKFYENMEENYDDRLDEIEELLFEEIDDEDKFEQLKKISELLEINIF